MSRPSDAILYEALQSKIAVYLKELEDWCNKTEAEQRADMKWAFYKGSALVAITFTVATIISFRASTETAGVLNDIGQCTATYLGSEVLSTLVSMGTALLGFSGGLVNGAVFTETIKTTFQLYGDTSLDLLVTPKDRLQHAGKILAAGIVATGAAMPPLVPFWDKTFSTETTLLVAVLLVIGGMTALSTIVSLWAKLPSKKQVIRRLRYGKVEEQEEQPINVTRQQQQMQANIAKMQTIIDRLNIVIKNPHFVQETIPRHHEQTLSQTLTAQFHALGTALAAQSQGQNKVSSELLQHLKNIHYNLHPTKAKLIFMLALASVFEQICAYGLITGWEYGPLTMIAVICSLLFAAVIVHFVLKEYSFKKPSLLHEGYNTVYETAADRIAAGLFWFFACFSWASVGKLFVTGVAPIYPTPPTCAPLRPGELLPNMNWGALMGFTLSAVSLGVTNGMVGEPVAKNDTTKLVRNLTTALFTGADENVSTPTQAARRAVRRFFQDDRFMNTWGEQIFNEWRIQKICKDLQRILMLYQRQMGLKEVDTQEIFNLVQNNFGDLFDLEEPPQQQFESFPQQGFEASPRQSGAFWEGDVSRPWTIRGSCVLSQATWAEQQWVNQLYHLNARPGYRISSVQKVYSPLFAWRFKGCLGSLERRHGNALHPTEPPQSLTNELLNEQRHNLLSSLQNYQKKSVALAHATGFLNHQTSAFSDPRYPHLHFVPVWHGTSYEIAKKIIADGEYKQLFNDIGYFGSGIYTTLNPNYAHEVYTVSKERPTLILNWLAYYSSLPITTAELKAGGKYLLDDKLRLIARYDTRIVGVVGKQHPQMPHVVDYLCCSAEEHFQYLELISADAQAVLPAYFVELTKDAGK